ncbi:ATP-binding cassette domain-containing protein [Paraclostridium sp. AKS81]|uniref:ATP-binding cassette domain-containing protein n=1 Tax=Paraclostridium sp. AKS81 TaxID=2876117 RepID=UPI0021DF5C81|nr:ABC transporter ATP-binding protein [Paraclostridium sp. AKS81]MCU9811597.1 ABC transporter ATP-binding protein [Paraclostridium sp. AKS81]
MISCKNLKVGYEEKVIIENLSLSINKGEVVSIIGPNGCGKSTLLKTLSRIIKPMSGEIYIQNESIKN